MSPFSLADEPLDESLLALQREYVREAPARISELRKDLAAFRNGEPDALESLRQRFHRLAGSGGSYGLPRVTEIARAMEHRILTPPVPTPQDAGLFDTAIADLRTAFDDIASDAGLPIELGGIPGFAYRTLVMMRESELRDALVAGLTEGGFEVDVYASEVDPLSVSASHRPDLAVVSTDIDEDPVTVAR